MQKPSILIEQQRRQPIAHSIEQEENGMRLTLVNPRGHCEERADIRKNKTVDERLRELPFEGPPRKNPMLQNRMSDVSDMLASVRRAQRDIWEAQNHSVKTECERSGQEGLTRHRPEEEDLHQVVNMTRDSSSASIDPYQRNDQKTLSNEGRLT